MSPVTTKVSIFGNFIKGCVSFFFTLPPSSQKGGKKQDLLSNRLDTITFTDGYRENNHFNHSHTLMPQILNVITSNKTPCYIFRLL